MRLCPGCEMITGREHDDAVPDVPCDAIREVRMPTSEVLDASADFRAASSPDAAAAAKLSSTPAAAIFAGDEAGMGAPGCSFEATKQDSQM